jgi:subtilisin-like proprotein convertase family protein
MPTNTHFKILGGLISLVLVVLTTREMVREIQQESPKASAIEVNPRKQLRSLSSIQKIRATSADQVEAWHDLMAGRPFVLSVDGRAQRFTLSLSELYLTTAPTDQRFKKITPQAKAQALIQAAKELNPETTGWVIYPEGHADEIPFRQILHKRIHLQSNNREKTIALLKTHGLKLISEPDYSPGSLIIEPMQGGPEAALKALEQLSGDPSIQSIGPLLLRQRQKHFTPNDVLFTSQWHLKNTGQGGGKLGADMNVTSVWDTYKGQGINIAIVDDGLQILHPDLAPNADSTNHYDWNDSPNDSDPAPKNFAEDFHGTSVGGVAAARGNNSLGVSGVAPETTLIGFRLISSPTSDLEDAEAMDRGKDIIHIKNNSWGAGAVGALSPAGELMESARQKATETGREGKGTIFVWSAGNGRDLGEQGQKDGFTNSMYVTTVGATNNQGELSDYSITGSHLVVSAPSSGGSAAIFTTDLAGDQGYNERGTAQGEAADLDYTNDFGGTSSAAPAVSGAIALMLEANPNLNWRDVKEILLRTSTQLLPSDPGWISRQGGDSSLPVIKHHQSFGGGQINVQAAVTLAETWTPLGTMIQDSRTSNAAATIPDNNAKGIQVVFDFSTTHPMRVEHAKLNLNVFHQYRGDLEIKLTSPSGTVSTLATKEGADDGLDYFDWDFSSVRHWGESAQGKWVLNIKDIDPLTTGTFDSATLSLYGTNFTPVAITAQTSGSQFLAAGQPLTLDSTLAGDGTFSHAWLQNLKQIATTKTLQILEASLSHAGRYQVKVSNLTGSDTSEIVSVSVVNRTLPSTILNLGANGSVTVQAAGEGLTYEWKLNGQTIPISGKLSGMGTKTLSITNMQPEVTGSYTCVVRMSGVADAIETLPVAVELRYKPVVTPRDIDAGIVSGAVNEQISAINGSTRFTASGLPPGVSISPSGLLTGRPARSGTFKAKITATNLAGSSPPVEFEWEIKDFPLSARGTWTGIVQRESGLNTGFGGRVKLTISNTGTYTGTITLGTKSYAWASRIDALINNADPATPLTISRSRVLTPLTGKLLLNLSSGRLSGTISDGSNTVAFEAFRNPWSATTKPVQATTAFNAALEIPDALALNAAYPQGHGHVKITVGTTGIVTWAGKLADATTLTGSSTLGPLGETSFHSVLNLNTGSAQGWSTITLASGLVEGTMDWLKSSQPANSTSRSYKSGIPLHTLNVRGARYIRPASPAMILDLDPQPSTGPLLNNAKLRFTGLPLNTTLEQTFKVTKTLTTSMPSLSMENPQSVRLAFSAATGTLSGTFSFSDEDPSDTTVPYAKILRTGSYSGMLVTRPDLNQGVGYFNLAELPDTVGEKSTSTPIVSGKAELIRP